MEFDQAKLVISLRRLKIESYLKSLTNSTKTSNTKDQYKRPAGEFAALFVFGPGQYASLLRVCAHIYHKSMRNHSEMSLFCFWKLTVALC